MSQNESIRQIDIITSFGRQIEHGINQYVKYKEDPDLNELAELALKVATIERTGMMRQWTPFLGDTAKEIVFDTFIKIANPDLDDSED